MNELTPEQTVIKITDTMGHMYFLLDNSDNTFAMQGRYRNWQVMAKILERGNRIELAAFDGYEAFQSRLDNVAKAICRGDYEVVNVEWEKGVV